MKWLLLILALLSLPAGAEEPARLDLGGSALVATGRGWGGPKPLELRLSLTKAVPYRTYLVDGPPRLIVDLKGADLGLALPQDLFGADLSPAIRWGPYGRDWARVVVELPGPYRIDSAGQRARAALSQITVALAPVAAQDFAPRPSATAALRDLPEPADVPGPPPDEAFTVVLDPGHGGFDPGALAEGESEANLVLVFSLELRAALQARGVTVEMTRTDDSFVALERRMTTARQARADLFISLHADALPEGQAAGATIYVWNPAADARAADQLTLRHDRDDLLAGADLTGHDDALAGVLMDFARTDTQPRSESFARWLTSRMSLMGIGMHDRPVQRATYSVLKSPDIPSVLLELGFISDHDDRANLLNPQWRDRMVKAVSEAVVGWARDEAARAAMLRQ
ncbi:N-acetylmuramoyl-L-alanine amidase AmiA precursor [Paracoccus haematequi]|uniref:N-acetylmuramoyl-L-alanine amidase n=1 Tax=Paracoccus haematequi TaxID=2491866 RepID=A0A447IQX8_9RHOB|nr:N-acetylmuramoyl-L-alanine amidase [Paracoccus haematequi]VDS09906.1 N-acetylmuramoyl-L-alanine amidase AmiA precursor [Paracoccus haematequi]